MRVLTQSVRLARVLLGGRVSCHTLVQQSLKGKSGLEIGGPSRVFQKWYQPMPIYSVVGSLDNCVFSDSTVWASHPDTYVFHPRKKPGKTILCEGSDLASIPDGSYGFVLSSHNLEHFANPIKALKEWERVVRPDGYLVLVLPFYAKTFDHRRRPTEVNHLFGDFERNTPEDDLTHLPEILQLHDLNMDPLAGSFEQFRERSLKNSDNRCLHHHVFDERNSCELLQRLGMDVIAVEIALPIHIFLFAQYRK
jgi:SAM-dependent methyltransferase